MGSHEVDCAVELFLCSVLDCEFYCVGIHVCFRSREECCCSCVKRFMGGIPGCVVNDADFFRTMRILNDIAIGVSARIDIPATRVPQGAFYEIYPFFVILANLKVHINVIHLQEALIYESGCKGV